jgi:hypothetical protein
MQRVVNRLSTAFNCQSTTNDAGLEIPRQIRTLTVVGWDQTNPVSTLSFPPTFLSILVNDIQRISFLKRQFVTLQTEPTDET